MLPLLAVKTKYQHSTGALSSQSGKLAAWLTELTNYSSYSEELLCPLFTFWVWIWGMSNSYILPLWICNNQDYLLVQTFDFSTSQFWTFLIYHVLVRHWKHNVIPFILFFPTVYYQNILTTLREVAYTSTIMNQFSNSVEQVTENMLWFNREPSCFLELCAD